MYWCTAYKLVSTDCNLLKTGFKIDEYVEIITKHTTNMSFDVAHDNWNVRDLVDELTFLFTANSSRAVFIAMKFS